jgi:hypothetical protein
MRKGGARTKTTESKGFGPKSRSRGSFLSKTLKKGSRGSKHYKALAVPVPTPAPTLAPYVNSRPWRSHMGVRTHRIGTSKRPNNMQRSMQQMVNEILASKNNHK